MSAALAARERDDLALGQLLPAAGAAQAQLPFEHDQEFVALAVVVEDHTLARLELVQARTEVLGACPLGDVNDAQPSSGSGGSRRLLMPGSSCLVTRSRV